MRLLLSGMPSRPGGGMNGGLLAAIQAGAKLKKAPKPVPLCVCYFGLLLLLSVYLRTKRKQTEGGPGGNDDDEGSGGSVRNPFRDKQPLKELLQQTPFRWRRQASRWNGWDGWDQPGRSRQGQVRGAAEKNGGGRRSSYRPVGQPLGA